MKKESKEGQPIHRPIIVKFVSDRSKQKLFHQKKKLKGTGISIFEILLNEKSTADEGGQEDCRRKECMVK